MPELAEVEHSRRIWEQGRGKIVRKVIVRNEQSRIYRGLQANALVKTLKGQPLASSVAIGKLMVFRFGKDQSIWLGIHLGMRGKLRTEPGPFEYQKHDHLILVQDDLTLVFSDQRHFGRLWLYQGIEPPLWWSSLPPSILSDEFTEAMLKEFLGRRRGSPLKAVLLMQERFPGIGNWMADEILWRARLKPERTGSSVSTAETRKLYGAIRDVAREAIEIMDHEWNYPDSWLFAHRWEDGGSCPRCGLELVRKVVGGRRTCWCPKCQPQRSVASRRSISLEPKRPATRRKISKPAAVI